MKQVTVNRIETDRKRDRERAREMVSECACVWVFLFVYVCVCSVYCVRGISSISKTYTTSLWIFKKAFQKFCHSALWAALRAYNINPSLINVIQHQHQPDQRHTTSTPTWSTPYNINTNLTNVIQHQHQPDLRHTTLTPTWPTSYNINTNLTNVIQH